MNTGVEVMRGNLQSWSWKDITRVYKILGEKMKEYDRMRTIFGVDDDIDLTPRAGHIIPVSSFEQALAVGRWFRDVKRLEEQITCLDAEITRRNQLVGVI